MTGLARHGGVAAAALAAVLSALTTAGARGGAPAPRFLVAPLPVAGGVTLERNEDVEPGIGVDGSGTVWAGSNIDPNTSADPRGGTALTGEDIWKSSDGGRTFRWV